MVYSWFRDSRYSRDRLAREDTPVSPHPQDRCDSLHQHQWPISEIITCNARDVIWRTDYGGKNGEFLVFMDAEDSSEGLVKAATRKKVYKCLEVC